MNSDFKQINKVLTIVFYLLAAATLVLWFVSEDKQTDKIWMYCGLGALGTRIITYVLRFLL